MLSLNADHYGSLERLGAGKPVTKDDMAPLVDAGLVKANGQKFQMLPAGRRELSEFKDTRQTALERETERVMELDHGKTLTLGDNLKGAPDETRKLAEIESAYSASKAEKKAAKAAAFEQVESANAKKKAAETAAMVNGQQTPEAIQAGYTGGKATSNMGEFMKRAIGAIPRRTGLPADDTVIQDRFNKSIERDPAAAASWYRNRPDTMGGKMVSADIMREYSPDYLKDRTKSAAVHEGASKMAKDMFNYNLQRPLKKSETPDVVFTGGGTGAGKTSGMEGAAKIDPRIKSSRVIYDSNLSGLQSSARRIDTALAGGNRVHIVYTYRHPVEAFTGGMLPRAMKQEREFGSGRTVPIDVHAETHADSNATVRALAAKYAGNENVHFHVIDNSHGRGNARVIPVERMPTHNYNDIRDQLNEELTREHQSGRISDSVYHGVRGEPIPESRGHSGAEPEPELQADEGEQQDRGRDATKRLRQQPDQESGSDESARESNGTAAGGEGELGGAGEVPERPAQAAWA